MKKGLKQSYLDTLEELEIEYTQGNKQQAFEILCAIVAEILKEMPNDGKQQ